MADTEDSDKVKYLKSLLGKVSQATLGFGDDKQTDDSIEPVSSPIDMVAGAAGAKLGGALAQDAGTILGNEVGTLGSPITQEALAKQKALRASTDAYAGQPGADINSLGRAQQNYNRSIDNADRMRQQIAQARAAGLKKLSGQ